VIIPHKSRHFFFLFLVVTVLSFCFTAGSNLSYAQERMGDVLKSLEMDQKMATPPKEPKAPPVIQQERTGEVLKSLEMDQKMATPPKEPKASPVIQNAVRSLRALVRRVDSLIDMRSQEKNTISTAHESVASLIREHIVYLDQEIEKIRRHIADLIEKNPYLKQRKALLDSIPVLGKATIPLILADLDDLEKLIHVREKEPAPPVVQKETLPQGRVKAPAGQKIAVKKIIVEGSTLINQEEIDAIIVPNEGKSLNLEELGMIAEVITAKYMENGYIISYAYLPPQEVKDGIVRYRVVEGKVGEILVTRDKPAGYFSYSDAFIKRYIRTVLSDPSLREDKLENSLILLSEYNGLTAKSTLKQGKAPGTTDIVTNVTDKFPWAASLFYDNFGSSTTSKHRTGLGLDFGNLLTSGDLFLLRGVTGLDRVDVNVISYGRGDYVVPLGGWGTKGGVYYTNSLYKAGQDLEILEPKGKANIAGVYLIQPVIKKRDQELSIKIGFDYKNINEYLLGDTRSTDHLRILGGSFTYDFLDRYLGKNVITAGFYHGVPDMMDGSHLDDPNLSRVGARASFKKATFDLMRIQKLPGYNHLILRANSQWSPDILFVAEQYTIGGMGTVRGYNPSVAAGDKGYTASAELVVSPFFPEATIMKHKFGDIFKLAAFMDHGYVVKNEPMPGETKTDQLTGIGGGFRIYWGQNFMIRFDLAVPRSADSGSYIYDNNMTYLQTVISF
jgi:hemolysin activation/secretion protein